MLAQGPVYCELGLRIKEGEEGNDHKRCSCWFMEGYKARFEVVYVNLKGILSWGSIWAWL